MASPRRWGAWVAAGTVVLAAVCTSTLVASSPRASAGVTPGVRPDIVMSPKSRTFNQDYSTLLINDATPQADPAVVPTPDQCRDLPPLTFVCDVYRIKVVRDKTPGAANFMRLLVTWDPMAHTPSLALVAAGLSDSDVPDIDLFLYKDADTYIDYHEVGGRGALIPERMAWEATQDEYDLVVRAGTGVATQYSINVRLSDELFDKPFEFLDEVVSGATPGAGPTPDGSAAGGAFTLPPSSLAVAPVDDDAQIAGIGLGTTEQYDPVLALGHNNTRQVAATSDPPSTLVLVLAMVLLPFSTASFVAFMLRRRRDAYAS
jgi:hypothetical protein